MKIDKSYIFDNMPILFLHSRFLINDMDTVFEMLKKWGIIDYHNVFSSINLFFTIENEKYIFYIDKQSIFFRGKTTYEYSFGELFVSTSNVLRKGMTIIPSKKEDFSSYIYIPVLKPITDKYTDYKKRYKKPTVEFIKEFYNDLLSFGYLEVIAILIIRDFFVWHSKPDELENYNPLKANSINHGLQHCMDSITIKDFFLYDEKFFDMAETYNTTFFTTIMPINKTPTILYFNVSLHNLYSFDRYNIISKQYKIRICEYCKCFFIQNKDYSTKYCDNCKSISYEKKVTDPFLKLYRAKYKTMKMRASRTENQTDYENKFTIPWENDIKSVIDNYRSANDIEGFETYIKNTMEKYKP